MSARVAFAYSLKDYAHLNARMRRLLFRPRDQLVLTVAPAATVVVVLLLSAVLARLVAPQNEAPAFVFLGVLLGGPAVWAISRFNASLARRAGKMSSIEGAICTIEARPEYLLWTGPDWRTEIAWSGVDLVDDGPEAVMIVFRGAGYFAPRRAFADDAARAVFLAECAARLTPEARARSRLAA